MKMVAKVAKSLCQALNARGHKVDTKLVVNAAQIHDALRVCDFQNLNLKYFQQRVTAKDMKIWERIRAKYGKIGHTKALTKILKKDGYPDLARLVSKHGFHSVSSLKTLDEKILFYADKRAEGDRLVTLKTRFSNGNKKHGHAHKPPTAILKIQKKIYQLEAELKKLLGGKLPLSP
ncbi:MAG: hypothetical protein WC873_01380 [Candidatus Gracilibacteria bacterium]